MLHETSSDVQSTMVLEVPSTWKLYMAMKTAFDILLSVTSLLLLAPLMVAIVILIKLDSPGPPLFVQERVGKGGRIFRMYKFRTMHLNYDERHHRAFMKAFINGQVNMEDSATSQADLTTAIFRMKSDPRVTRVGVLLRKSSLDELPQLINVLKGDMSIVGPRPLFPYHVERQYPEEASLLRLNCTPGMTGLSQISGSSSYEEMVALDIEYAKRASLWMDLEILIRSTIAALKGKKAY